MSYNGHDPHSNVCPACGERCVHRKMLSGDSPKSRGGRPKSAAHENKRHRVVCYLDSNSFTELLKIAGGKDMSHVVRGIIEEALKR